MTKEDILFQKRLKNLMAEGLDLVWAMCVMMEETGHKEVTLEGRCGKKLRLQVRVLRTEN